MNPPVHGRHDFGGRPILRPQVGGSSASALHSVGSSLYRLVVVGAVGMWETRGRGAGARFPSPVGAVERCGRGLEVQLSTASIGRHFHSPPVGSPTCGPARAAGSRVRCGARTLDATARLRDRTRATGAYGAYRTSIAMRQRARDFTRCLEAPSEQPARLARCHDADTFARQLTGHSRSA